MTDKEEDNNDEEEETEAAAAAAEKEEEEEVGDDDGDVAANWCSSRSCRNGWRKKALCSSPYRSPASNRLTTKAR